MATTEGFGNVSLHDKGDARVDGRNDHFRGRAYRFPNSNRYKIYNSVSDGKLDLLKFLKSVPLFRYESGWEYEALATAFTTQRFNRGETVFHAGSN